jgi:hypothetical protein
MIGTMRQSTTQSHLGSSRTSFGLALMANTVVKMVKIAVIPIANSKYLMV